MRTRLAAAHRWLKAPRKRYVYKVWFFGGCVFGVALLWQIFALMGLIPSA